MAEKFKQGDAVKVLSQKHTLQGELVEHAGKFVRELPDGWAEVELEQHHSIDAGRKVFNLMVPIEQLVAALLLLFLFAAPTVRAQDLGKVGLSTISATVANGATCTGSPQLFTTAQSITNFRNIGQTSHLATATSNASQFQMEIDGIDNLGNVFRLSDLQLGVPSSAKGGLVVTAAGYMANIQISVTCTAAATFSVSYSGSFSPQPPSISAALLVAVDKLPFQTAAANATASTTFQTPGGNSSGTVVFQYAAAGPAGSTVTVQCVSNSGTNLGQSFVFNVGTGTAPQFFNITQSSCPFVTLTYTSGGASATTYNLEYVFNVAGTQQGLQTANSGPSATLPIQIISDSIQQAFDASPGGVPSPGANQVLFNLNANSGSHSLYLDKLYITSSAVGEVRIQTSATVGTGCSAITVGNLNENSSVTSTGVANQGCTGIPGGQGPPLVIQMGAGTFVTIDLRGLILPAGTTKGIFVFTPGAITGNLSAWGTWYER
jgi:hypothetical protein